MDKIWLQGGPFLEVSFLLELEAGKKEAARSLIRELSALSTAISFADEDIDELIAAFVEGYPSDEENPKSPRIHSLLLRIKVDVAGLRKAILQVEQLSTNALLANFWFYGSQFDDPAHNQRGIKTENLEGFERLLIELYASFNFKAGGISIEQDISDLFNCEATSPSEHYRFENLSPEAFLLNSAGFYSLLWNEGYGKLSKAPSLSKRTGRSGVLLSSSASYSEF
ncbi:hypothetical protein [Planomicrobium sp. CPCC 101110]|uniref:hypothetical protein n=1 Tax=Planomicrobium sp. CPCC 101110 TaxID=2599619 RepID=UPI0011B494A6|nr:hypothetical protein [Planomicrobium sp. CPCC 101110]TWT27317.1 hypothetical protein FQV30_02020 [Planomicrobium sp. CPCC 101110]